MHPHRGVLSHLCSFLAVLLGIVWLGAGGEVAAESVDTELVLLVDISSSGLKKSKKENEFSDLMDGYASAMTSEQVLDSIESGSLGKIAVSMVFYGDDTVQVIGVPWMTIGSAAEAAVFAAAVRAAGRPASGSSSMSSALDLATSVFGTETGGADNGYSSLVQVIEVAGATQPRGGPPAVLEAELRAARNAALASGVDVINAISLGKKAAELETYYSSNVIGGEVGGVVASTSSSDMSASLTSTLTSHLDAGIEGAAIESVSVVPEPGVATMFLLLAGVQLIRIRVRRG